MCSAAGGTIEIRPAPPDTITPISSLHVLLSSCASVVEEGVALDHAVVELALLLRRAAEGALELRVGGEDHQPPLLRQLPGGFCRRPGTAPRPPSSPAAVRRRAGSSPPGRIRPPDGISPRPPPRSGRSPPPPPAPRCGGRAPRSWGRCRRPRCRIVRGTHGPWPPRRRRATARRAGFSTFGRRNRRSRPGARFLAISAASMGMVPEPQKGSQKGSFPR